MDVGMEYEVLLLQLGSLTRKHYAAEETLREQQEKLENAIKRMSKKNANLEKLQRESLSNTILKLLGSYQRHVAFEATGSRARSDERRGNRPAAGQSSRLARTRRTDLGRRALGIHDRLEDRLRRSRADRAARSDRREVLAARNPDLPA